jgi:ubiquinone/menaquinone biosynthesis C-methylase UbiE
VIARYDGHAQWYDETLSAILNPEEEAFLREALGPGGGQVCLDVACGTGRYGQLLAAAGYRAVGFDISADQLGGRVGFHHKTLASFLEAFAQAGLTIRAAREFSADGHVVLPWNFAVVTEKNG